MGINQREKEPIQNKMAGSLSILLSLLSVALVNGGHHGYYSSRSKPVVKAAPTMNIAEIAAGDSRFSTLLAAVKAAGLAETLSGPGTFTVFAPTNDAFAKIPADALNGLLAKPDDLKAVLLRHVLPNEVPSSAIPNGSTTVGTVGGEDITVLRNYNTIKIKSSAGSAKVILADVAATNGIIHAVDTVF